MIFLENGEQAFFEIICEKRKNVHCINEKQLLYGGQYAKIWIRVIVYRVVASHARNRGEVVWMEIYEVLSLLFLGGSFLIALLAYIDRNNKQK